jgi:hypothetical protein
MGHLGLIVVTKVVLSDHGKASAFHDKLVIEIVVGLGA